MLACLHSRTQLVWLYVCCFFVLTIDRWSLGEISIFEISTRCGKFQNTSFVLCHIEDGMVKQIKWCHMSSIISLIWHHSNQILSHNFFFFWRVGTRGEKTEGEFEPVISATSGVVTIRLNYHLRLTIILLSFNIRVYFIPLLLTPWFFLFLFLEWIMPWCRTTNWFIITMVSQVWKGIKFRKYYHNILTLFFIYLLKWRDNSTVWAYSLELICTKERKKKKIKRWAFIITVPFFRYH